MGAEQNKALVRQLCEAFNRKDLDGIAECAVPGAQMTYAGSGDSMGVVDDFRHWAEAFPKSEIEIKGLIAEGDLVAAELVGRGVHDGPLSGPQGTIPATGRQAELSFCVTYECQDGKIRAARMYMDLASLMSQLGAWPQEPVRPSPPAEPPEARI